MAFAGGLCWCWLLVVGGSWRTWAGPLPLPGPEPPALSPNAASAGLMPSWLSCGSRAGCTTWRAMLWPASLRGGTCTAPGCGAGTYLTSTSSTLTGECVALCKWLPGYRRCCSLDCCEEERTVVLCAALGGACACIEEGYVLLCTSGVMPVQPAVAVYRMGRGLQLMRHHALVS